MNRTREKQEAAPQQAQDYVWGWRDVPAPVRLDVVCGYLDAASMGRLEICGRQCLGDAARAAPPAPHSAKTMFNLVSAPMP